MKINPFTLLLKGDKIKFMKTSCSKHSKYKGKGKPKHECSECLSLYVKFGMTRVPVAPPSKVILSKKDKLNKPKHKKNWKDSLD